MPEKYLRADQWLRMKSPDQNRRCLSHSAGSRGVFADGAVQAALYVAGRQPGYYTMTDLLRGKLPCV